QAEVNRELTSYLPNRTNNVLSQYTSNSLYPSVAAPEYNQFGGSVATGFQVTMTNPSGGTVYYTTDGTDPRVAFTGAVGASAQVYNPSGPPALGASDEVQARVPRNGPRSPPTDAPSLVGPPPARRGHAGLSHPA